MSDHMNKRAFASSPDFNPHAVNGNSNEDDSVDLPNEQSLADKSPIKRLTAE